MFSQAQLFLKKIHKKKHTISIKPSPVPLTKSLNKNAKNATGIREAQTCMAWGGKGEVLFCVQDLTHNFHSPSTHQPTKQKK